MVSGDDGMGDAIIEIGFDFSTDFSNAGVIQRFMGDQPHLWDFGVWDTMLWDESGPALLRYGFRGTGNLVRYKISDDGGSAFHVNQIQVEIDPGGMR